MNYIKKKIFSTYSSFSTFFENKFFKNSNLNSFLKENGFIKLKLNNKVFENLRFENQINKNDYFKILILSENEIHNIISKIFLENNILDQIISFTGFNYKISFLIAYETLNIPDNLKNKQIYANHWHFDKPYSKNTLKIIIPLEEIGKSSGSMKILNIENSKNLNFDSSYNKTEDFEFTGDESDVFLFYPNLCAHKAGIPDHNIKRKQIMFQLNPSKKWCYSKFLYNKQFKLEPKFPLKDIFEKTIEM